MFEIPHDRNSWGQHTWCSILSFSSWSFFDAFPDMAVTIKQTTHTDLRWPAPVVDSRRGSSVNVSASSAVDEHFYLMFVRF